MLVAASAERWPERDKVLAWMHSTNYEPRHTPLTCVTDSGLINNKAKKDSADVKLCVISAMYTKVPSMQHQEQVLARRTVLLCKDVRYMLVCVMDSC